MQLYSRAIWIRSEKSWRKKTQKANPKQTLSVVLRLLYEDYPPHEDNSNKPKLDACEKKRPSMLSNH